METTDEMIVEIITANHDEATLTAAAHYVRGDDAVDVILALVPRSGALENTRERIYESLAQNRRASGAALSKAVVKISDAAVVAQFIANHTDLPEESITRFADDPRTLVRFAVAASPNLTADAAWKLQDEWLPTIDSALAENPVVPHEVLYELWKDRKGYGYMRAQVAAGLAKNPNCPPYLLQLVAEDHHCVEEIVWKPLLDNPMLPDEALQSLCERTDGKGLLSAVANTARKTRICQRFPSVDPKNVEAIDYLAEHTWWALDEHSPELQLALGVFRN